MNTIEELKSRLAYVKSRAKPYPYTVLDPCYSNCGRSRWDREREPWVIAERALERKIKELETVQ